MHNQRNRGEIAQVVVGHIGIQRGIDRQRADRTDQQRVTVRLGLGDMIGGDVACGAGFVFHHHGLSPGLAHFLGNQPRDDVGAAAGGKADDEVDRAVRVALCKRRRDCRKTQEGKKTT